jgi:hypothetical protein
MVAECKECKERKGKVRFGIQRRKEIVKVNECK